MADRPTLRLASHKGQLSQMLHDLQSNAFTQTKTSANLSDADVVKRAKIRARKVKYAQRLRDRHSPDSAQNEPMADQVNRDELNAKLEAAASGADARHARFEQTVEASLNAFRQEMSAFRLDLHQELAPLKSEVSGINQYMKGIKINIWTGVATVVGVFVAVAALAFAAFDSGRDTSTAFNDALLKFEQRTNATTDAQIERLEAVTAKLPSAPVNLKVEEQPAAPQPLPRPPAADK